MNETENTLISSLGYPAHEAFSDSFSFATADLAWTVGDLSDISGLWTTHSVGIEALPQGTSIPGSDHELKYALVVEKRITPDGIVIRSDALDEEGFGLTRDEAYIDFLTSLRDRYNSLKRRAASLSTHDSSVLEKLRDLLSSTEQ